MGNVQMAKIVKHVVRKIDFVKHCQEERLEFIRILK